MQGKLYIVATPIGNLSDITLRALEVLKSVDLIASEDTRVSKKLLDHYEIKTKLVSYYQHSQNTKVDFLINELKDGKQIAVITDAGTPGISDPGNKLVEIVSEKLPDYEIITIPGPSAVIAALSISGLPTDKFLFLGFLPHKKSKEKILKRIIESKETIIFYESPHRIIKTLTRLNELLTFNRRVIVCRELTKKFETTYRGNIGEVIEKLSDDKIKGEFTVIISGKR